jgi:hypothetical protein
LKEIYPEHQWKNVTQRKEYKPSKYWQDKQNQRTFFDQLASKLHIQTQEDWYSVRLDTVIANGGYFVHTYYGGSLTKGKLYYQIC